MEGSKEFFLIKEVLLNGLNKDLKSSFVINLLEKHLDDVFGINLKRYIKIEKYVNNKLYVICKHQGIVQSLFLNKEHILDRIKNVFNNEIKIKDIIFYFKSTK